MVFFVCGACQETLKGAKVPLHRCHGPFSCVDCSKDFTKTSVSSHNSCISEAQKYQGALYKGTKAKKDPQAEWMTVVISTCESARMHQPLFARLATFSNVPRKKAAFCNFGRSSLKVYDQRTLDDMFSCIEETRARLTVAPTVGSADPSASASSSAAPPTAEGFSAPQAAGKRRREAPEAEPEPGDPETSPPTGDTGGSDRGGTEHVRWKKAIKKAVALSPGITAKKLRRRVLKEAAGIGADDTEAAGAAFDKKFAQLVARGALLVEGGVVSLCE